MTTTKELTAIIAEPKLSIAEKAKAIDNEYHEFLYWKTIEIGADSWFEVINTREMNEDNATSIDSLYLEEWLDVDLLYWVREHHNMEQVPDKVVDKYDDMSDCMTYSWVERDKKKFFVMKEWKDWNGIRKTIWNEEGNFEERTNPDDNPDWLNESIERDEKIKLTKNWTKLKKYLWKYIKDYRIKYKTCYDAMDKIKSFNPARAMALKISWDKYYKQYLKFSKYMDEVKSIDEKAERNQKVREANHILSMYIDFQQVAPSYALDKLTWEKVKELYKKYGYGFVKGMLEKELSVLPKATYDMEMLKR